jgi:DNA invertase Pin-like site-specific DNA recombinase
MSAAVFSTSQAEAQYLEDDPRDPSRKLIRQVLGAVSEYERAMITLRLRAGRDRKRANGGYAGGGPAYGWRAVDGELEPVPEEQRVIETIRRRREAGWSWARIADELTAAGVPPARRGRWYPDSVRRVALR